MTEILFSNDIIDYKFAENFMEQRVQKIADKKEEELIWFLEHNHIYTAGTSARDDELLDKDAPTYKVGRGGRYTYHGPGQRVVYLMLDLKKRNSDVRAFIFNVEDAIIKTFEYFGIKAHKKQGIETGIWVGEEKIAFIGIRIRKWITYHGISININPDLSKFNSIVPCGIKDKKITSLKRLQKNIDPYQFDMVLLEQLKQI